MFRLFMDITRYIKITKYFEEDYLQLNFLKVILWFDIPDDGHKGCNM